MSLVTGLQGPKVEADDGAASPFPALDTRIQDANLAVVPVPERDLQQKSQLTHNQGTNFSSEKF